VSLTTTSVDLAISPLRIRARVLSCFPFPSVELWMSVANQQTEDRTLGSKAAFYISFSLPLVSLGTNHERMVNEGGTHPERLQKGIVSLTLGDHQRDYSIGIDVRGGLPGTCQSLEFSEDIISKWPESLLERLHLPAIRPLQFGWAVKTSTERVQS
jgi:hypothetical protein